MASNTSSSPPARTSFALGYEAHCVRRDEELSGIGARVTITAGGAKQMDEIRSGGSFPSQNDLRLHFGLGRAALIERAGVQRVEPR